MIKIEAVPPSTDGSAARDARFKRLFAEHPEIRLVATVGTLHARDLSHYARLLERKAPSVLVEDAGH